MKKPLIPLILLAGLALAACKPSPAPTASATPLPTVTALPTPLPSATAAPTSRPTATQAPTVEPTLAAFATQALTYEPTLKAAATQAFGIDLNSLIKDAVVRYALEELNKEARGLFTCLSASWKGDQISLLCELPTQRDLAAHQDLHFMVIKLLGQMAFTDQRTQGFINAQTRFEFTTASQGSARAYRSTTDLALLQRVIDGELTTAEAWAKEAAFTTVPR